MKTIKLSLVALATLLTVGASAQIGIQAGYSSSTQTVTGSLLGVTATSKVTMNGFHVGPVAEMTVQGPISLQYGLLYNYLTATESNIKTVAHELDLPVRIAASFPVGNGLNLFAFGGPNFNYAISQKTGDGDNMYSQELNGKKIVSPFDVQLGAGAGLKYNSLILKVGYDWGLLNKSSIDNTTFKSNALKISLAYMF